MSRKDDPVFNVKFVQLVEGHPCLWNSSLPSYSKKDEIQKAWQEVANETKDTVRNCRERWRTIRSSFLRSLKLARTTTGRGKRKYYLSKYLQFLIPYTKSRLKTSIGDVTNLSNNASLMGLRKSDIPDLENATTRTGGSMPMPVVSSDDTKDSTASEITIVEENGTSSTTDNLPKAAVVAADDVMTVIPALHQQQQQHQQFHQIPSQQQQSLSMVPLPFPLHCITAIKTEAVDTSRSVEGGNLETVSPTRNLGNSNVNSGANNYGCNDVTSPATGSQYHTQQQRSGSAVDLTEFAEWIKSKNDQHRHCLISSPTSSPDADQSFLNSLHPYMKEMSGKQNRRFRQKVVALIDAILDNTDC